MNKYKGIRKIVAVFWASLTAMCCFGCSFGGEGRNDGSGTKYGKREKTITFSYYAGGYGTDWLEAVIDDYMLNVDTTVYIDLKRSTNNETARTNIKSGVGTYDLYQLEVDMFNCANCLADLTDLYDMEVYGEAGVKVRDKIDDRWVTYYEENGSWRQLPQTQLTGWNWAYNKDTLDKTLGENNYTLPRTTDEFFALGDELYKKGVYLTAFPGADTAGGDYSRYAFELWFAQMVGLEGYQKYMSGYYKNDAGEWTFAEDAPKQISQNSTAITEAYKVAEKLCTPASSSSAAQYMHAQSMGMQFKDVDVMLYGGKYRGQSVSPIAFSYVGGWLETEVAPFINAGTITENQDVRAMKMPVISAIIERTPTINDESTLVSVIDYVDGVSTTKPTGVSDDDIAIIEEARNMVSELICRQFVIPKNAKNIDEAKKFLCYLVSDRAQKIAAKATRGISMLPYGYEPTEEDMGFTFSNYTKSVNKIKKDSVIVDLGGLDMPYRSFFSMSWYVDSTAAGGTLSQNLFTKQAEGYATIADSTYKKIDSTYTEFMKMFKVQYPSYVG